MTKETMIKEIMTEETRFGSKSVPNLKQVPDRRRSRYIRNPQATVLTPASLQLLETVAAFRLISLPQLVQMGELFPRALSAKATQRAMRTLFDAGLVDVVPVPRAALAELGEGNDAGLLFGSAPNIYQPARAGIKLLAAHGLTEELAPPPAYGPQNALLLRHELGVRDMRVWLTLTARQRPAHAGQVGQAIKVWHDGPEAVLDLGRTQPPRVVRPDAWFVYRLGQREGAESVLVGLLEFDRATERGGRRWLEKLAAYQVLFSGERLREATGYVRARVLVICPTSARRARLADLIAREAAPDLAQRFWLADRTVLNRPDLTTSVWQRPGSSVLQPLVPAALLKAPS